MTGIIIVPHALMTTIMLGACGQSLVPGCDFHILQHTMANTQYLHM